MRTVRVAAAAIIREKDGVKELFATQRAHGNYSGYWEFPGGKIEGGETSEEALVREIREELDIDIFIDSLLRHVEFDYPEFHLSMDCYLCHIEEEPKLLEHKDAMWLPLHDLLKIEWLPADMDVLKEIEKIR